MIAVVIRVRPHRRGAGLSFRNWPLLFSVHYRTGVPAVLLIAHLPLMDWMMRREEKQLAERFGEEWTQYTRKSAAGCNVLLESMLLRGKNRFTRHLIALI